MPKVRKALAGNVLDAAIGRMEAVFADGHRVVVSFSGGKDSTCALEVTLEAARRTRRLPVEVVMRDEEVGWPGHYEYVERVAQRPEVAFLWVVAREPHSLAYDRQCPFWWTFDPKVEPGDWVRRYPDGARETEVINIEVINSAEWYPPPEGKDLVTVIGIKAAESGVRNMGVFSMGGHLTGVKKNGSRGCWPIYDWKDADVWRAIREHGWDYAGGSDRRGALVGYDGLLAAGLRGSKVRMGAMLNRYGIMSISEVKGLWPEWYGRMCDRFPSLNQVLRIGQSVLEPKRWGNEPWEKVFRRECIKDAPGWLRTRSELVEGRAVAGHAKHASEAIPDATACPLCPGGRGSWQALAKGMYLGDPFSEVSAAGLPYVEPQDFRPELAGTPAGRWGGHPG